VTDGLRAINRLAALRVVDRHLARTLAPVLWSLPLWLRQAVEEYQAEIRLGAQIYESLPVAAGGNSETPDAEMPPSWMETEVGTREAAELLGVSARRARQLAAGGLGRKVGSVWVLDRALVVAEATRRRAG
jgi:hypothetical protein